MTRERDLSNDITMHGYPPMTPEQAIETLRPIPALVRQRYKLNEQAALNEFHDLEFYDALDVVLAQLAPSPCGVEGHRMADWRGGVTKVQGSHIGLILDCLACARETWLLEAIKSAFLVELYPTEGECAGECPDNGWDWHTDDYLKALLRAVESAGAAVALRSKP